MTNRTRLLLLALLLVGSGARADDAESNANLLASQPNGCGSGWTIYLVPNSIPLGICTFRAACDEHDGCYGKCEGRARDASAPQCEYLRCRSGGDLHGSLRCTTDTKLKELEAKARSRRKTCDAAIGAKIKEINDGKVACIAFAYVFENAVKQFGNQFFQGLRPAAGLDQEDYEGAIREFFLHGTTDEFEAFNANPPDLAKPIKYEPGKGLVNTKRVELPRPEDLQ